MGLPIRFREVAPRLATGAYILNAGLEKRHADSETAQRLQGFASGAYPMFRHLKPAVFVRLLSTTEILLGATLLTPFAPTAAAGAALTAFSGGLMGVYLKTPGMRKEGSLAPTPQGLTISKDVWMLGIGVGLLTDAATRRLRRSRRKPGGSARSAPRRQRPARQGRSRRRRPR